LTFLHYLGILYAHRTVQPSDNHIQIKDYAMKASAFVAVALCFCAILMLLYACDGGAAQPDPPVGEDGDGEAEAIEAEADTDPEYSGPQPCLENSQCPEGMACDPYELICKDCQCDDDSDCRDYSTHCLTGCPAAIACYNCLCLPARCEESIDCETGYCCYEGTCCDAHCGCGHTTATGSCRIDLPGHIIVPGDTMQPLFTAYNQGGAVVPVDNSSVTWSSSDEAIATLDTDGAITGGNTSGRVTIRAEAYGESCEAGLTNIGLAPPGTMQVWVMDAATGEAIDGATVLAGTKKRITSKGEALFPLNTGKFGLHVFHRDYSFLSLYGVQGNQILAPLYPREDTSRCGGVKGEVDFSKIPEALKEEIRIAITGHSLKTPLLDMGLHRMIGFSITSHVRLGSVVDTDLPFPSGLELFITKTPVRRGYVAPSLSRETVAWSFGGYVPLSDIISIVTLHLEHPWRFEIYNPFMDTFYHGLKPGIRIEAFPKITDTADLNNNGNLGEMICDVEKFEELGSDLALNQPLNGQAVVTLPPLPENHGLGKLPGIALIMCADVPGAGLTPLNFFLANDEDAEGVLDGLMGEDGVITVNYGLQHSGVTGNDYVFLAMAFDIEDTFNNGPFTLRRTSVQTRRYEDAQATIHLGAPMAIPSQSYSQADRSFSPLPVGRATLQHFSLLGSQGERWDVWAPANMGGVLPSVPESFETPVFTHCNSNSIDTGGLSWHTIAGAPYPDISTLQNLDLAFTQGMETLEKK